MKYAHIIDNELRGWYDSEIHTTIPPECIEVSDEAWEKALEINANYYDEQTQSFEARDLRTLEEIQKEQEDGGGGSSMERLIAKINQRKWIDVLRDRGINVTYTNTTGIPIEISVGSLPPVTELNENRQQLTTGYSVTELWVNNEVLQRSGVLSLQGLYSTYTFISATIPPGATYKVISSNLWKWWELR